MGRGTKLGDKRGKYKPRKKLPPTPCLTPHCDGVFGPGCGSRGLCPRCYSTAKQAVAQNVTTWEELQSFRLANPSRRNRSLLLDRLSELKGKQVKIKRMRK